MGAYNANYYPQGIAIDGSGNVWVTNYYNNTVTELNASGTIIGTYAVGSYLSGIAIDASGNVWVAGNVNGTNGITELSPTGVRIGAYATGYWFWWGYYPGIAIDGSGNMWETTPSSSSVAEFLGATTGPQFFPYAGPQFAGGGNW